MWGRVGYTERALKLTFRGKNLGENAIRYNPVHHEVLVNAYAPYDAIAEALAARRSPLEVEFLHGYPSAIADFAWYCASHRPDVVERIRRHLKGVLLGSEYPAQRYRDVICATFNAPVLSWYGHSEMAVLAEEVEPFLYRPFCTYGYAEAVEAEDGRWRLVGTSFDNMAGPFIRYDTGDYVEPFFEKGHLAAFRVKEGRVGDFVVDRNGRRVSLTALVFGRHHELFSWARFLQVRQERPGEATIMVTCPVGGVRTEEEIRRGFDGSNVAIEFGFEVRREPFRTVGGKVPLLVGRGRESGGAAPEWGR
jgi:phenylacetate-CoA ligase